MGVGEYRLRMLREAIERSRKEFDMRGTKSIGGTDGMHFPGTGGFGSAKGMKGSLKTSKMVGVHEKPGGEGDKISANSARKPVKGSINGPGVAK